MFLFLTTALGELKIVTSLGMRLQGYKSAKVAIRLSSIVKFTIAKKAAVFLFMKTALGELKTVTFLEMLMSG